MILMADMARLLIVGNENLIALLLQRNKELTNCEIATAFSGEQALRLCERGAFDVLITDRQVPGMDGAQLAERVHQLYPQTAIVLITGHNDLEPPE
jgi:CheY-like chemotaxis protein